MPRTAGSLGIAVALTVLMAGSVGALVAREIRDGWITVHVHENHEGGAHLTVPVPAWVAQAAIQLVPDRVLPRIDDEEAEVAAVVVDALRHLDDCGNATLVEVDSSSDHVTIRKDGGALLIDVTGETDVSVRLPL
ncbi:MAG: hypothetical protein KC729_20270, partial [Candidatus Eisenbacteria bacterium]|nr:hypothetical protein [Candidatus Eisenbacteria bacterium]